MTDCTDLLGGVGPEWLLAEDCPMQSVVGVLSQPDTAPKPSIDGHSGLVGVIPVFGDDGKSPKTKGKLSDVGKLWWKKSF